MHYEEVVVLRNFGLIYPSTIDEAYRFHGPGEISISNLSPPIRSGLDASSKFSSRTGGKAKASLQQEESSAPSFHSDTSLKSLNAMKSPASLLQTYTSEGHRSPSLSIAVIGATGELARRKIFPALFALYYSGNLPEV